MIPRKPIFRLLIVFIFVDISYGKKCYAPVICDDGEYTKPAWTEISASCQSKTNLLDSKPGNTTGQKGEKGEMGVIANSTISALRKELAAQKTENKDINATIYDLQRVIKSFNKTVEFLKEENQKLETEKLELRSELNKTFQKQLTELKAELNKLQLDTDENKRNITEIQIKNQKLEIEKAELKLELNKTFQKQLIELAAQKTANEDINATIYDLQRVIKSFNGTVEFMKEENKKVKAENAKINKTFTKLISELPMIDCKEAVKQKAIVWNETGGVFNIFRNGKFYEAYCDATTDGGGWTVFQRRMDGSVDFYRTWEEYAAGFGNKAGEFWLGLENIYQLTLDGDYELRVDLTDWDGSTAFARYGTFSISGRSDNFALTIGDYSGTAGDSMTGNNGQAFTAKDKDLDIYGGNCAEYSFGAWWFRSCGYAFLNGIYNDTSGHQRGVLWYHWKNNWRYSFKASEMKFRKK